MDIKTMAIVTIDEAKIVAIDPASNKRKSGAYRGKISVGPEFFAPLPEDELNAWE